MRRRHLLFIPAIAFALIAGFTAKDTIQVEAKENVVVVLDPGHDAMHVGARGYYGVREEECNMQIALSCKEELEQYDGVTVYLTHDTLDCANPWLSTRQCLYARADYAKAFGADVLISLHNNAGADARGYEIYYPNGNYIPEFHEIGYDLSQSIANQLGALGLNDRGLHTRNSDEDKALDENWYPDGSRADYYAIIRTAKYHGFVGMIIEHAYVSNEDDAALLADDSMLHAMGVADATGIAEYYHLTKKSNRTGVYQGDDGNWYYYNEGEVVKDFNGIAANEFGEWYITDGQVDFSYTGLTFASGIWNYVVGGKVAADYTGLAGNEYGWWYVANGQVDFTYNGLVENVNGWWKITDGRVAFEYTGVAENEFGWWKITDGRVDFNYTGIANNEYGWWRIVGGQVDFTYTGVAENEYGWWKVTNGAVDFTFTGLASNEFGWWYIDNGQVDFSYTGLAANEVGTWYVKNGGVDFTYNGTYTFEDKTYSVTAGLAAVKKTEEQKELQSSEQTKTSEKVKTSEDTTASKEESESVKKQETKAETTEMTTQTEKQEETTNIETTKNSQNDNTVKAPMTAAK